MGDSMGHWCSLKSEDSFRFWRLSSVFISRLFNNFSKEEVRTMSDREIFKVSKEIAREMGVGSRTLKLFLLGRPRHSLASLDNDEIRRSLKYVDESIHRKEHAFVPFRLMMSS
ncbi:MAG: hypothetical protein ACD_8C00133G0004 [uncultured bacterium]|nr:MAG: hypothetical protein ACD_8C00133G0004 [uncultured bacterium]